MDIKNHPLSNLNQAEFLRDYWQKKPLLIKGAFPPGFAKFSADELAGISLESDAKSRLIQSKTKWTLKEGPFEMEIFKSLPNSHWTLLIQEVEQWIDEVSEFRKNFDFIPRWRADDIMVSYATEFGGVGAHVDHYDVFLLQAMGQRNWKLESGPVTSDEFLPDLPLRILKNFNPSTEILVEEGDLLYLPPEWAHEGRAANECMTWSIGFRAPSTEEIWFKTYELLGDFQEEPNVPKFLDHHRYSDPNLKLRDDPYSIEESDLLEFEKLLKIEISDAMIPLRAMGELVSEPLRGEQIIWTFNESKNARKAIEEKKRWQKDSALRIFYSKTSNDLLVFANGLTFTLSLDSLPVIKTFCCMDLWESNLLLELISGEGEGLKLVSFLIDEGFIGSVDEC